jgi:hypothetical protein
MSTIFEAFVLSGEYDEIATFLEDCKLFTTTTRQFELEEDMSVIFVDTPPDEILDPELVENIAKAFSEKFSKCLYVYWNDLVNSTYTMLYDETGFLEMFGEDDEIWLEYDEKGYPLSKTERYTAQQVKDLLAQNPEKLYDCIFNALDAGLLSLNRFVSVRSLAVVVIFLDNLDDDDDLEDDDLEEDDDLDDDDDDGDDDDGDDGDDDENDDEKNKPKEKKGWFF